MEISHTMDLHHLAERIGDIGSADYRTVARHMRDALVERFDGQDTKDIPEADWSQMVERACVEAVRS